MAETATPPEGTTPPAPAPEAEQTFSLEYVQGLRNEAAGHRVAAREASEQARAAVTAEFQGKLTESEAKAVALQTDLGDAWVYAAKVQAAVDAGVPTDKLLGFVGLLKGSDEASIKASAESAKALFGGFNTPATDPTQGHGGGPAPLALNGDPLLAVVKRAVGAS